MRAITLAALGFAIIAMLLVAVLMPKQVEAAGTVGNGSPMSCTEAALDAALAGGGLVTFNCGAGPVPISLSSQKTITLNTTIDGGSKITLSGGGSTRLFSISVGASLSLSNLTLSNGSAGQGGAIYNNGRLIIVNSTLFGHSAPGGTGGAIYNTGVVTITDSTLSGNIAGAGLAGGIHNIGTMTIISSTFSGNFGGLSGGAIGNGGTLTISDSSFENNSSSGLGGAINNFGPLTIRDSTFFSNTASGGSGGGLYNSGSLTVTTSTFYTNTAGNGGGGIYNSGSVAIAGSTLSDNRVSAGKRGGGIYNDLASGLTIDSSTLANNSAPGGLGGGIYNNGKLIVTADTLTGNAAGAGLGGGIYGDITGTVTITNSTFSGNFGGFAGGGLIAGGPVTVTNSTFYSNTAGGLVNGSTSAVAVKNTIVADNTSYNCSGTITSLGHNLDSANTCAFAASGDLPNTNPLLGPLADNGGSTPTHALLPGSPAINAGTNAGCPATDQRGVPRPQFGTCDIGAYEYVIRVYLPVVLKQ